jgi:NADH:ubiquinone oxidoreductase subunit 5 (subunit L)/multisubunit Na+/H+ antiporter MnhA subunit
MSSLVFSSSFFIILIRWDLLGLRSFFLVNFYNNWERRRGAVNTVLRNRVGDIFLFFSLVLLLRDSTSFILVSTLSVSSAYLVVAGFTKSAQFPFIG